MPAAAFHHFSDQLYCSGSEERWCSLPRVGVSAHPGECFWFTPDRKPVSPADMVESTRGRWPRDVWDATTAGAVGAESWRTFDRTATAACLANKHVLVLGESTTRDLFIELVGLAGLKAPAGGCMNTGKSAPICTRVVSGGADNSTRLTFQFLSAANASREIAITRGLLADRPPDITFVQCMMYDWYGTLYQEPSDAMGEACMQLVDAAVLAAAPRSPVYLLGPTYPPAWVSPYDNRTRSDSPMARIFNSINHAAGIRCTPHAHEGRHTTAANEYRVVSSRGIRGPIDRYNVVGHRKRDRIHPFPNAHVPTLQMMLNFMC